MEVMHGNSFRYVYNTTGNQHYSQDTRHMQVPFRGINSHDVMPADGIWIGAFDDVGNLKLAAQQYDSEVYYDFVPGPVPFWDSEWNPGKSCSEWDTIWSVHQFEILRHIADWEEDGVIDHPHRAVFGWPGRGNPFFEEITGIRLPDHPTYSTLGAPFHDANRNGAYEPHLGEYPHPENVDPEVIVSQMTWSVFNDFGTIHTQTQGDNSNIEVQLTTYSFNCAEGALLSNSLFKSYLLVNRSTSIVDSAYFGVWTDPTLRCEHGREEGHHFDDMFGSWPEANTFFYYSDSYLEDPEAEPCFLPVNHPQNTWTRSSPVLAYTFLNQDLSSFNYYVNGSIGNQVPGMTEPQSGAPLEYYRLLTGSWRDGWAMTRGGVGYLTNPGEYTKFAFDGNPLDTASWAMTNIDSTVMETKTIGAIEIDRLDPGETIQIDLAISFVHDSARSSLGNVELMYGDIPKLQAQYDSRFGSWCTPWYEGCGFDCIYAGDANHDGTADGRDFLVVAQYLDKQGTKRSAPLGWAPAINENWNSQGANGTDLKHADCNGDGIIEVDDLGISELHYARINEYWIEEQPDYGNDIVILGEPLSVDASDFSILEFQFDAAFNVNLDSLYGYSFSVAFDSVYWKQASVETEDVLPGEFRFARYLEKQKRLEFSFTGTDLKNRPLPSESIGSFRLKRAEDILLFPHERDTTYLEIGRAQVSLANGEIINLKGRRVPVVFKGSTTSVSSPNPIKLAVYPNPTSGSITVRAGELLGGSLYSILDYTGRLVESGRLHSDKTQIAIESPGIYVLIVQTYDGPVHEKFVVTE